MALSSAIALAQRGHLRLHRLHLRHRGIGFVGQREERGLDQHGDDQDREAEIADQAVEIVDREEQRLGDEVEPAPVDQQIEAVEVELLFILVDDRHFLGAGEQPRVGRAGRARRDGLRVEQIVGLVGRQLPSVPVEKRALRCAVVSGTSTAAQYLSVMPSQPLVTSKLTAFFSVDVLVGVFLQAGFAEHADQAFMQDVVAERSAACHGAKSAHKDRARLGLSSCW